MANPVTEYLRQIGAKGGAAGRGSSKARSSEAARAAVQARWAKAKRRKTKSKPNTNLSRGEPAAGET